MKYEEMVNELEEANRGTIKLNSEYHSKLHDYINYTKRIKDISFLLKEADQIRRKYNNDEAKEKIEVLDADGRKKTILKEDADEYLKLVEEKKNLIKKQKKLYNELLKMQPRKNELEEKNTIEIKAEESKITKEPAINSVEEEKKEKQNMKEKFLSVLEDFENEPLFNDSLETTKRTSLESAENIEYPKIQYSFDLPERSSLIDLNDYLERNKIKINPLVKVKFRNGIKVNLKKAWFCTKNKLSLNKIKKLIPKAFNIDKYTELGAAKLYGKLLDSGICIRDTGLKFSNGVSQKYNSTKSYITNIPKRTENYISGKYNDIKDYLEDKKLIRELKNTGIRTREAMQIVYGDEKEKHLDYRIVNRVTNFKDNTCQRVNSMKSKVVSVSESVRDTITKPFAYLRENVRDNVRREELQSKIEIIRQQNLAKKRVLTNADLPKTRSGYVGSIAVITISVIILSIIIFVGIGSLLGR